MRLELCCQSLECRSDEWTTQTETRSAGNAQHLIHEMCEDKEANERHTADEDRIKVDTNMPCRDGLVISGFRKRLRHDDELYYEDRELIPQNERPDNRALHRCGQHSQMEQMHVEGYSPTRCFERELIADIEEDLIGDIGVERFTNNAPDIVGFKNARREEGHSDLKNVESLVSE